MDQAKRDTEGGIAFSCNEETFEAEMAQRAEAHVKRKREQEADADVIQAEIERLNAEYLKSLGAY